MRAKIVDIGEMDAFYYDKERFIGCTGDFKPFELNMDEGEGGDFTFDNKEISPYHLSFIDIKVEPLIDNIESMPTYPIMDSYLTLNKPPKPIITEPIPAIARHGHPKFYDLCMEEMTLHDIKNHDYSHGGDPLGNFNRVSAIKRMYPKMDWSGPIGVAIGYLMKQLDAALWMQSEGYTAKVEGPIGRWQDVSIYSKIIEILIMEKISDKCC